MMPCTEPGSSAAARSATADPPPSERTPPHTRGSRPRGPRAPTAAPRAGRSDRGVPRAAPRSPRPRAVRARASSRSACRRPSPAAGRGARASPCTRRGAGRRVSSRSGRRGSRGGRRRPSADPRTPGRSGGARRGPRGSDARPRVRPPSPPSPASRSWVSPIRGRRWRATQRSLVLLRDQLGDAPVQLGRCLAVGIRLQDARLGFDHLAERPIAHPVAVGQAPALPPGDQVRHPLDVDEELVHQSALPDPGFADERHELRLGLMSRPIEGVSEQRELPLTTDERGVDPTGDVDAVVGSRLERLPDRDRGGLPLRLHGIADRYSIARSVARNVASPTRIPSTGAEVWSRPPCSPRPPRPSLRLRGGGHRARRAPRPCVTPTRT